MATTPRRSTRGAIFTPSPFPSPAAIAPNTTFAWTSAPTSTSTSTSSNPSHLSTGGPSTLPLTDRRTYYNSFTRITSHSGFTPRKGPKGIKGRPKVGKEDEESRFSIGDGVLVKLEGNSEGVGVLIRLWEEPEEKAEEESEKDEDAEQKDAKDGVYGEDDEDEEMGTSMMAEIHWCFRRQDLPGIMKNLSVEDNEVLLAASPIRRVTTSLPISLLVRTIPIYSLPFFRSQFAPTKSVVKGWTYIRQGVYWCAKAFDKGAKGGKVWKVDIDEWREGGKAGLGWDVKVEEDVESDGDESGSEGKSGDETMSEAGDGKSSEDKEDGSDGEDESVEETSRPKPGMKGRKRGPITNRRDKAKQLKTSRRNSATPIPRPKGKRLPHPKSSSSHLPADMLSPEQLPTDPYQRALRLLHVGATPESLPCREEEFVDVLSKVEEGVESGGGGCLYIAGVPGTGKTATVHAVVKELRRKAEDGELPPFSYVEINGLKIPSPQHAYTVLWEAISGAKGSSAKTALRGLESHFGRKTVGVRGPRANTFVVLMDELDQLLTAKQDVVYNFFNWPTMRDSQLFVIAVANRMDLPQHLAAKIKSRLGLQTLLFQPYDRTALVEIVQSRLIPHPHSKAEHKVLQPDAIALAATKMAGTNGDARRVLDACRRAVEVAMEGKAVGARAVDKIKDNANNDTDDVHPVTAKEMMSILNQMSSSPVALFLKQCSDQQKMMMVAVVRCIRREGIPEIPWIAVRTDHDALTRSLLDSNDLLSNSELALTFSTLVATHALTWAYDVHKSTEDRRVALGMEIGEVGRVLMNEGDAWRRALAGI